jgi:hypothetical protein
MLVSAEAESKVHYQDPAMPSVIFGDDTDPHAEQVLIEGLRRSSNAERGRSMVSLTDTVRWLSRRAIHRAHPDWNERQLALEFVRLNYGQELADRVGEYLKNRPHESR